MEDRDFCAQYQGMLSHKMKQVFTMESTYYRLNLNNYETKNIKSNIHKYETIGYI